MKKKVRVRARRRNFGEVRRGFTMVEVMLSLAISGLIFIGLVGGLTGMVARQRYNVAVDTLAEYLRNVYSETSNPQTNTESGGDSEEQAIYGRLVVFGTDSSTDTGRFARNYLVLGNADVAVAGENFNLTTMSSSAISTLDGELELKIKHDTYSDFKDSYGEEVKILDSAQHELSGGIAVLILRNLSGGNLRTYVYDCENSGCLITKSGETVSVSLGTDTNIVFENDDGQSSVHLAGFKQLDVNFCVVSGDSVWAGGTRNVRLVAGGTNSGAVQVVEQDSDENVCRGL